MNIKLLKLSTGEDVICEYKEEEDKAILENPIIITIVPSEEGIGIGMALPWMIASGKDKFKLNKRHIVCKVDPPENLANQYSSQFGSGIVIAHEEPDVSDIIL
jgi:hypothetical protein